jgi:hypothetical protein
MKPVDPTEGKGFSLRRWSQRKAAARAAPRSNGERDETTHGARDVSVAGAPVAAPPSSTQSSLVSEVPQTVAYAGPASAHPQRSDAPTQQDSPPASPLPSIDSLSIDSDFTGFMQPGVDESLKRGALKKLFSDPRFNVMDGLDVYIDDYSKPDPIDPAIVRTLAQARYIFNPPLTRVTAEGYVEDIPEEELRTAERAARSVAEPAPEAVGQEAVGQEAAAALTGAEPRTDAIPAIVEPRAGAVASTAQPRVESVMPAAQPQHGTESFAAQSHDDALPATKAKPEA